MKEDVWCSCELCGGVDCGGDVEMFNVFVWMIGDGFEFLVIG